MKLSMSGEGLHYTVVGGEYKVNDEDLACCCMMSV